MMVGSWIYYIVYDCHSDAAVVTALCDCVGGGRCGVEGEQCSEHGACRSTGGALRCVCNHGYTGDGLSCTGSWQVTLLFPCQFTAPNNNN